jgi:predicted transcriptional regulator
MTTTIQVSDSVKKHLESFRLFERETYNDIIERLIEDSMELNEQTKKDIETARKEIKSGKVTKHEDLKKELGF